MSPFGLRPPGAQGPATQAVSLSAFATRARTLVSCASAFHARVATSCLPRLLKPSLQLQAVEQADLISLRFQSCPVHPS